MDTKQPLRRRCISCRKWYRPHPSAVTIQKCCSAECRRSRRRYLAKRCRLEDLESYRAREKARKRSSRQRRRAVKTESAVVLPVVSGRMSRASLSAEATELQGNILRNWDKTMELSRAGLQAYLLGIFGRIDTFLGQVGQKERSVTG